jgi:hypothetical protein
MDAPRGKRERCVLRENIQTADDTEEKTWPRIEEDEGRCFCAGHRRKKVPSAEPKDEVTHGAKHVTAFCRLT